MTVPGLVALGRFIAQQHRASPPATVRRAARVQILNMVAAAHAGREALALVDGAPVLGGGAATIVASGRHTSVGAAALANAACSMAHDFDDIVWMGHTGHSAVFASLALAEAEGASAHDFVTAVIVANEVAGRLGASSFLGPLNGQMWTFIHLAGAAAAGAFLLGLDEAQCTHALAIALSQPNFALQPGFMAPSSKLLAAAVPTQAGMMAPYFARAGMTGAPGLLEDQRGFWRRFSFLPLPGMLDGLGETWALSTLTIKTYPGCHYFQTASTALAQIQARRPVRADDVVAVEAATTKLGLEATRFARDYVSAEAVEAIKLEPSDGFPSSRRASPSINANFDLATTLAIQIVAGRLTTAELAPQWLAAHADAVRAVRARIHVRHDPALTAKVLAGARGLGSGRRALASLGAADLARLIAQYRREYRSSLVTPAELGGWLKLLLRAANPFATRAASAPTGEGALPLYFPNRVELRLRDGTRESAQVELPVGSIAAADVDGVLADKVRATMAHLGEPRLRQLLAANLDALPPSALAALVAGASE